MRKKSSIEMERQRIAKVTRSLIRLKYSLQADIDINNSLPDTLIEFDKALQSGELLQLRPIVEDLLGEV